MPKDLLKHYYILEFSSSRETPLSTWICFSSTKQAFEWDHFCYTLQLNRAWEVQPDFLCCSVVCEITAVPRYCSPNTSGSMQTPFLSGDDRVSRGQEQCGCGQTLPVVLRGQLASRLWPFSNSYYRLSLFFILGKRNIKPMANMEARLCK